MKKEGLQCSEHTLEHSLSHDTNREIRQAVHDAALRTWNELQSIDAVVERELPDGVEREDTRVYQHGNEAGYQTEQAELPVNYEASEYKQQDEEDKKPAYNFTLTPSDVMWEAPAEAYERQMDLKAHNEMIREGHLEYYPTAEMATRVANYKLLLGYAMSFFIYKIKSSAGV